MDHSPNGDASVSGANSTFSGKSRKPNWTDHEIRALIEEYNKHRRIMKSRGHFKTKDGQVVNNTDKHKIWDAITEAVNCSQPDGNSIVAGMSTCTRTVKEVIKKWVNLINKMRADVAASKGDPGFQLCMTSKAIHIIVNTDDPLDMDNLATPSNKTMVKIERTSFDDESYFCNDYHDGAGFSTLKEDNVSAMTSMDTCDDVVDGTDHDNSTDNIQKRENIVTAYSRTSPVKVRTNKRKMNRAFPAIADGSRRKQEDWMVKRLNIDKNAEQLNGHDKHEYNGIHSTRNSNAKSVLNPFNGDNELDSITGDTIDDVSSEHTRYIRELQTRKLQLELDRMLLENQKLEIEKEKMIIEKETALLAKEKMHLELEILKNTYKEKTK